MTKEEIIAVLAEHKLWREGSGGERANLSGADLSGANLHGAYLSGANLHGAILREGIAVKTLCHSTMRSDGYTFFLWATNQGFRIQAGCRFFDWSESESHWRARHKEASPELHEETQDILAFFSRCITRHKKENP